MNEKTNAPSPNEPQPSQKLPDRPLECSECRRSIKVRYTEVVGDNISEISMCAECPELERRLQGAAALQHAYEGSLEGSAGLACGNCGTTLDALRVGMPVGCSNCYEVFHNIILDELIRSQSIPPRLAAERKNKIMHIGRSPGEGKEVSSTLRLLALNEALNETLAREDYEQAALLRDQIRELTEKGESENE